ncbi:TRAM domain-containing protein, partial [Salmonella enterica subsp. enterica serovar Heidelberg]|nr:TRAM domain-containing protein [Salmonella enterica subsp. enterica serovar Heidelberg]
LAFNRATAGKSCAVLIERQGKLPGQMLGKSPWLQSVYLDTGAGIGDMVEVEIAEGFANSLSGVEKARAAA